MRSISLRLGWLSALVVASALGCGSGDETTNPVVPGDDAGADATPQTDGGDGGSDADAATSDASTPVDSIPLDTTLTAPSLSAPVDIVRDEHGIPHIYGANLADVVYAQGWVTAHDRLVQMDLLRHNADGSLTKLVGALQPTVFDGDVAMRAHHLRATAQKSFDAMKAGTDADSKLGVAVLASYTAGVNAFAADLQAGKYKLPTALALLYSAKSWEPWTEVDSLLMGNFEAFELAFDADSEIQLTKVTAAAKAAFASGDSDPAKAGRAGLDQDLSILAPVDPTYTIDGWTGVNGDTSTAMRLPAHDGNFLKLLDADAKAVRDVGNDHTLHPSRGSNDWVVGGALTKSGHVIVSNDTHLGLSNPATFHLVHLSATDGTNAMGVAFPGIPGIILGMNDHIAWGATVNNIDVTDVYAEAIHACSGSSDPCVTFNGSDAKLAPRKETFEFGAHGTVTKTVDVTYYDVPQHGPIIARPNATHDGVDALGTSELSIRYTGYEPAPLFGSVLGLSRAKSVQEAKAALDTYFKYGGQNWVIGDDQGHFGWTEVIRVPRRTSTTAAPWLVQPGDGSAEWGADLDPRYIPHAWDPAKGFLATANADPIGVTDDGDPYFGEPVVGGAPLYLGWQYDPGTRVGRITKRLEAATANGAKVDLDTMQSIQADGVSEWAEKLAPTLVAAAQALSEELASPGTHAELSALATGASTNAKAILPLVGTLVGNWNYDSPSGVAEDNPTADDVAHSKAMLIWAAWSSAFFHATLDDELAAIGGGSGSGLEAKLLVRACTDPTKLKTGIAQATNDPWIFDDLTTTSTVESKTFIAVKALLTALDSLAGNSALGTDATTWRWGAVHTLALEFLAPLDPLRIPLKTDPKYPNGFPRHGGNGTVDVGNHGFSLTDYTYSEGPAIRFVCELDPAGPKGRNALPGGEIFDLSSPHYADQMELWRKNQTFDLAFQTADVLASATKEVTTNKLGRIRFVP